MGTIALLDLTGGVALLLWGLHMVQSGILRACGNELRRLLRTALGNRFLAMLAGLALTALLQSSTATGLIATSFTASGLMGLESALAVMLGANIGTTLIVQLLAFDISAAAPILVLIGVISFKASHGRRARDLGRMSIGLGLMLMALHILLKSLMGAENAALMRSIFGAISEDPVLCILLAGILTWIAHSSVATILLIMSLAYANLVTPTATIALVLGANLGSALNPLFEGGKAGDLSTRRLPVGNLLNRLVGLALVLPCLNAITHQFQFWIPDLPRMAAAFHTAFNAVVALIFIGFLNPLARLLEVLLPAPAPDNDPALPRHLDESTFAAPSLALADATRETLRVGEIVEQMLRRVMAGLMTNDRDLIADVSRMDDTVDRLDEAIKLFVTKLTRQTLDERETQRGMEIVSFATNLEHIGDIIDKSLAELAAKKIKRQTRFSSDGAAELAEFHRNILDSMKLAFSIFMSGDPADARELVAKKAELRIAETRAAEKHLERLRENRPETLETTSLHLDVLRDLRRIHSHIVSVAYPILRSAGLQSDKTQPTCESALLPKAAE